MISLINAQVFHARMRPKKNRFRYRVPYLAIPAIDFAGGTRSRLFSIDGPNIFGLKRRDYGENAIASLRDVLASHELTSANGNILLLTMPRVLGYVFNPVSFWFCFDQGNHLRAVLAQVTNTFAERHSYICFREDRGPIEPNEPVRAEKIFHVSPFLDVKGHYQFHFDVSEDRIAVKIDLHDEQGLILATSVAGRMQPLSDWRLLAMFLSNPLLMLKAIGLIHYQAAKLFLKGLRHFSKPPPPLTDISQ